MSDRELLELAAKAAQLPEHGCMGSSLMYVKDGAFADWNPLADDGDALRLAVKLNFHVCVDGNCGLGSAVEIYWFTHNGDKCSYVTERDLTDRDAATRRAITRAAAEIGKTI